MTAWRSALDRPAPWSRLDAYVVALLTLSGAYLRLRMRNRYLEYDEAFTYMHYGSGSFWNAVSNYGLPNNHIFHSICIWLTTHVLGLSVLSLRLPVMVAGAALVPLTYLLAREASGSVGAALSAGLTAGCGMLAFYSVDARGYGLQAALFVAALLLTPRLLRAPSARLCAAHVALTSLAMFTVPTLVFGVGAIYLWGLQLVLSAREDRLRRMLWLLASALLAALLTGLLYAPAIDYALHERVHFEKGYGAPDFATMCAGLFELLTSSLPRYWALLVLALVALDVVGDALVGRRIPLALSWLGWPLCCLAVYMKLGGRAPFPRNFVFLLPLLFVLAGRALELVALLAPREAPLPTQRMRAAAVVALGAVVLSTALPAYADFREAMRPGYLNSRYVFKKFMRPMRPGDELAIAGIVMDPVRIYAAIEGIALARMSHQWAMSIMQRSGPDGYTYRSLTSPGQRFVMIVKRPRELNLVPFQLRTRLNAGNIHWVARARVAPYTNDSPIVWQLVAGRE